MIQNQHLKNALYNYQDDVLWKLIQHSKSLLEFRRTHENNWNDSASREINGKYLNPHKEENTETLIALEEQLKNMILVDDRVDKLNRKSERIRKLSDDLRKRLSYCRDDLDNAADTINRWYYGKGDFLSFYQDIEMIMNEADNML